MSPGDATYTTKDGDMLDQICVAFYGDSGGYVESVLASNPGLSERGPVYHAGIIIILPKLSPPGKSLIRLYD